MENEKITKQEEEYFGTIDEMKNSPDSNNLILNKDKRKEIKEELESLGIKKVFLKETKIKETIGENRLKEHKELTLYITPSSSFTSKNNDRREKISKELYKWGNYVYDLHINSLLLLDYKKELDYVEYYPLKNVIIANVQMFNNDDIYERIIYGKLKKTLKEYKETEKEEYVMNNIWKNKNYERIKQKVDETDYFDRQIKTLQENLNENILQRRNCKILLKSLKNTSKESFKILKEELKKIKEYPFIKEVILTDQITLHFGETYINGKVVTGIEEIEGTKKFIREEKNVYIGNISIIIDDNIRVINNDNPVEGDNSHPHCNGTSPCFGEETQLANELLAELKISKLVKLLHSWIGAYEEDDCYTPLQDFYNANEGTDYLADEQDEEQW